MDLTGCSRKAVSEKQQGLPPELTKQNSKVYQN